MFFKTPKALCGAVIVAAGSGNRMGAQINKVLLPIAGEPMITHTLGAFENCAAIGDVVVVTRECDIPEMIRICKTWRFDKVACVVAGGATRQESVYKGLCELGDYEFCAIHDAARCLILPDEIEKAIKAAQETGASAIGVRCKDTLKKADADGHILSTIDRQDIWQVQTPQVFEREVILSAHKSAMDNGFSGTDDCELAERMGVVIQLVEGSSINLKVTTPDDLFLSEAVINGEGLA